MGHPSKLTAVGARECRSLALTLAGRQIRHVRRRGRRRWLSIRAPVARFGVGRIDRRGSTLLQVDPEASNQRGQRHTRGIASRVTMVQGNRTRALEYAGQAAREKQQSTERGCNTGTWARSSNHGNATRVRRHGPPG